MTDDFLFPAAQAVLASLKEASWDWASNEQASPRDIAVAALRALADQVVPEEDWPEQSIGFADWNLATERCEQRKNIRAEILAIAAELEGVN